MISTFQCQCVWASLFRRRKLFNRSVGDSQRWPISGIKRSVRVAMQRKTKENAQSFFSSSFFSSGFSDADCSAERFSYTFWNRPRDAC